MNIIICLEKEDSSIEEVIHRTIADAFGVGTNIFTYYRPQLMKECVRVEETKPGQYILERRKMPQEVVKKAKMPFANDVIKRLKNLVKIITKELVNEESVDLYIAIDQAIIKLDGYSALMLCIVKEGQKASYTISYSSGVQENDEEKNVFEIGIHDNQKQDKVREALKCALNKYSK